MTAMKKNSLSLWRCGALIIEPLARLFQLTVRVYSLMNGTNVSRMERVSTVWIGKRHGFKEGFTLVEILLVVIVVAILAASAIPIYHWAMAKAYSSEATGMLGAIRSVSQMWYAEHNRFWDRTSVPPEGPDFTSDGTLDASTGIRAYHNKWWHAETLVWASDNVWPGVAAGSGPWVLAIGARGTSTAIQQIQIAIGLDSGEFLVSYDAGASWKRE